MKFKNFHGLPQNKTNLTVQYFSVFNNPKSLFKMFILFSSVFSHTYTHRERLFLNCAFTFKCIISTQLQLKQGIHPSWCCTRCVYYIVYMQKANVEEWWPRVQHRAAEATTCTMCPRRGGSGMTCFSAPPLVVRVEVIAFIIVYAICCVAKYIFLYIFIYIYFVVRQVRGSEIVYLVQQKRKRQNKR